MLYLFNKYPQLKEKFSNLITEHFFRRYLCSNPMAQDKVQATSYESRSRESEVFYVPTIVWRPAVYKNGHYYAMDATPPERLQPFDLNKLWNDDLPIFLQSDLNPLSPSFTTSVLTQCEVSFSPQHSEHSTGDLDSILFQRSSPELRGAALTSEDRIQSSEFDILNFKLKKQDIKSISEETMGLIDFLCLNLKSHEWRSVARELGVDDVIITTTDFDNFDSEREQMKYVFCAWATLNKSSSYQSKHVQVRRALLNLEIFRLF